MSQPPGLVLLHGFTNTGASWQPVVRAVGERYRAIAPDIRGHGSASQVRPVTLDAVIEDIEALPLEQFTLGGYSMGGRIALHAAFAMPQRITRLVLIGASPGLDDPGERAARRREDERLAEEIERSDMNAFATRWAETPILRDLPARLRRQVHEDRLRNRPEGLAAALRGLGTGTLPSLWGRLGELERPVTLVVGERDQKFRGIAERMAELIGHADLHVVAGVGHAAHVEAPNRVGEAIVGGGRERG